MDRQDKFFIIPTLLLIAAFIFGSVRLEQATKISLKETPPSDPHTCHEFPNTSEQVVRERYTTRMVIEFYVAKPPIVFTNTDGKPLLADGVTVWRVDEDGVAHCRIFAAIPKRVYNDPAMDVLGHELLHCLIGSFHDE